LSASTPKLPGRYKGTRRYRLAAFVIAECGKCGWKSQPLSPKKAEKRHAAHVALMHFEPGQKPALQVPSTTAMTASKPNTHATNCPRLASIAGIMITSGGTLKDIRGWWNTTGTMTTDIRNEIVGNH
jgi:hypothetical protein